MGTIYVEVKLEQENRKGFKKFLKAFYGEGYNIESELFYDQKHDDSLAISFVFDDVPPVEAISLIPDIGELICFRTEQEIEDDPYAEADGDKIETEELDAKADNDGEIKAEELDVETDNGDKPNVEKLDVEVDSDADAKADDKDQERIEKEPNEKTGDSNEGSVSWMDEFYSILNKSDNKTDFIKAVAEWLELSENRQKLFALFVEFAQDMEQITWAKLETAIVGEEISFNSYDKQKMISAVRAKTGKQFPKFLKEISEIAKGLPQEQKVEIDAPEEKVKLEVESEEMKAHTKTDDKMVEMPCFRRGVSSISDEYLKFEKELNDIDKNLWLQERVRQVLVNIMGYREDNNEDLAIGVIRYATALIQQAEPDCDNDEIKANFSNVMILRLQLSNLIDLTLKKYNGTGTITVTIVEFLTDLRKVIMTSGELAALEK